MTAETVEVDQRVCEYEPCNQRLVRRINESSGDFARRRFCSPICQRRHKSVEAARRHGVDPTRTCTRPGCHNRLDRRPSESWRDFAQRKFCSRHCQNLRSVPVEMEADWLAEDSTLDSRYCPMCEHRLRRRRGETPMEWRRRTYCSHECATRAQALAKGQHRPKLILGALDWQAKAECRGTNLRFWAEGWSLPERLRLRDLAEHYCRPCPVRAQCRKHGYREPDGLWGGVVITHDGRRRRRFDLLATAVVEVDGAA